VCHNLAFRGDYTPVLAKRSKHFSLENALSIGVDRMQRNFGPSGSKSNIGECSCWRGKWLSSQSTGRSSRANLRCQDIWREECTTYISIRSTMNSHLVRCGASQTHYLGLQGTGSDSAI